MTSPTPTASPFAGSSLSRRAFARLGAGGLLASWFLPSGELLAGPSRRAASPSRRVRNVVWIHLSGGPSHVDTFDLKEGRETPASLEPTPYLDGAIRFPRGLMPSLAEELGGVVLVRSCLSWALVHGLAQVWQEIARNPASALGPIAPHIGSVVSLELAAGREASRDVLPAFLALSAPAAGAGYLPAVHAPFTISPASGGIGLLAHPDGPERFQRRLDDLRAFEPGDRAGDGPLAKAGSDLHAFRDQAALLIQSPDVAGLFRFDEQELEPWGRTWFGASCLVAAKLLEARRGVRFVSLEVGGWDHHADIYGERSLPERCRELDAGLSTLLRRLRATAGEEPGRSLLDETLVFAAGEFGRTTGALNVQRGRDHHMRHTVLFAGGGVRGGRTIGRTDEAGERLLEPGWSGGRDVRAEDLAATLYEALGIDWTTVRDDDPFGRGFEYVPYARDGVYGPVREIWG